MKKAASELVVVPPPPQTISPESLFPSAPLFERVRPPLISRREAQDFQLGGIRKRPFWGGPNGCRAAHPSAELHAVYFASPLLFPRHHFPSLSLSLSLSFSLSSHPPPPSLPPSSNLPRTESFVSERDGGVAKPLAMGPEWLSKSIDQLVAVMNWTTCGRCVERVDRRKGEEGRQVVERAVEGGAGKGG